MSARLRPGPVIAIVAAILVMAAGKRAAAQGPTIENRESETPGFELSTARRSPGALRGLFGNNQDPSGPEILGGRPGPSTPRVGPPTAPMRADAISGPALPEAIEAPEAIDFGTLDFPAVGEDQGPADGLTLDAAIELLMRQNIELRALYMEIPQAEADVLTAGLRTNPILYADAQLVPYGNYTKSTSGGPVQYDLNISYPLDITHKRAARVGVAVRAKQVSEAEFQNAVRLQIGNLYIAHTGVLAARQRARFAHTSVDALDRLLVTLGDQVRVGRITAADYQRVLLQREVSALGAADADAQVASSEHELGTLLNLAPAEVSAISVRGSLRDAAPEPPSLDALIETALRERPDVCALRLGVERARAEQRLAHANRMNDVFVLYQPYTFQEGLPDGPRGSHSWALGVTVPLPIFNRNQGNIERARLNAAQTHSELEDTTRKVITEVIAAEREYRLTRAAAARLDNVLRPAAQELRRSIDQQFDLGSIGFVQYTYERRDYYQVVRQYLETMIRHRFAMLNLNTVVGRRILP